ncbi:glutathione S-transferase N-terminal domain-containing protein [Sorangium cellulosum]|uniref:Glutathione S-transferase n=1 Tax=Sorangium cellulosum TaxID=56 RepID=A0A150QZ50_SORCE|nr:glutathione S-transferase N-terminal domain-containing protein [Sorangium cellulosum]KYF73202.1 glutathione S-transferase [Sorangium cellulosum]
MKLYFSPLACSLSARIALYEAGAEISYVEVDPRTKRTEESADYRAIHPLGLVPALEIEGGELVTENAAILQLIADMYPDAALAPRDPLGRARLQQWLSFIGTELHKALYVPLLDRAAPAEARAYALAKAESRLGWVAGRLAGREFLLDRFSVADAYLFTILNWSSVTPVDLKTWPALPAYHARLQQRPAVARAFAEERARYAREIERHAKAAPARAEPAVNDR